MTLTEKNALIMLEEQRRKYFETLQEKADKNILEMYKKLKLTEEQKQIANLVLKEINERLEFLSNVGLGYLTLS